MNLKYDTKPSEIIAKYVFLACALISVLSIISIIVFIVVNSLPLFDQVSLKDFLFGRQWKPTRDEPLFGIFPMITGTLSMTFFAAIFGVPIGLLTGVFLSEYASNRSKRFVTPLVELLAGIPSVVYGFFGVIVIVPFISRTFGGRGGGNSLLAGIIILIIMILPTIVTTSKTALSAVPKDYKEASYALGISKEHTILKVIIPAAKSGIFAGIILGLGRAIGETMAIILVTGNTVTTPDFIHNFGQSMTDPIRTLTSNIALEMSYSEGLHENALFATALVLLFFIMLLNILLYIIKRRGDLK